MSAEPAAPVASAGPSGGVDALPTGTVTFLFSDIEGSTRLLQALGSVYATLLADHDGILEAAVHRHGGHVFGHEGDAVFAAFSDPALALLAALDGQRELAAHGWPEGRTVRVRMGVHTGQPILTATSYVGLPLHQVARICASANGGQVLVSDACRALAADALPPGVELRDLGEFRLKDLARPERLHELVGPGLAPHVSPPRTSSARPDNLPVEMTTFVGRRELETTTALLRESRLLTLTGPGGTGKTRLALRLAKEVADDFADGVLFVALDAVDDAELVPSAIAHTLHLDLGAEPPLERLERELRDKRMLLVLDNFEQVVAAAPSVSRLLRAAPGITIVVTSRILLRAYGEREFSVPPLPPDEAVQLFLDRAHAASSSFRLDGNRSVVEDIVTRLDGLPLAIELAAARVRILPLETLRNRLDQRLATLTGGARDLPARQQTLRGAIDWSYDLLDEPDRRLFERLSVFSGGAGLTAIEAVCGPVDELGRDVLDGITSLVEKSLIRSVPGVTADPRFAMLLTIREYAMDRLAQRGEDRAIRDRHAANCLQLAEQCAPALTGPGAGELLARLEEEHDNVRAAIDWAIATSDTATALRLAAALWRFWQRHGHLYEAIDRFDRVLALPGVPDTDPVMRSQAYGARGSLAYWSANIADTSRFYALALAAAHETQDPALIAEATYNMGFGTTGEGVRRERFAAGRPLFAEALERYTALGDRVGIANATWALGISLLATVDREAIARFEDSLRLYRELGNRFGEGWALHMIGLAQIYLGMADEAERHFRESYAIFRETGDRSADVLLLLDLALVARHRGDMTRFWTLAGASHGLSVRTGIGLAGSIEDFVDIEAPTRPAEGPDRAAWDAGERLDPDNAAALALDGPLPSIEATAVEDE